MSVLGRWWREGFSIRTRIFLVYLILVGGGFVWLMGWLLDSIRPRYLESMEESLVDTANILASMVESEVSETGLETNVLGKAFDGAYRRRLAAQVYSIRKESVDLRVYVTDARGVVRYDSDGGRDVGGDYSRWLDVSRTLKGLYGARATRSVADDANSLAIHVAAPIYAEGKLAGVLAVAKPTAYVNALVKEARWRILTAGIVGGILLAVVGVFFSVWVTTPLRKLIDYARAVRDGKKATLPVRMAGRDVGELQRAFDEMQAALEGKHYVERYTQALAHEIKAPLAGLRGAAELLSADSGGMSAEERARFLENVLRESGRIQRIVDQLLQLAALEAGAARSVGKVDLSGLVAEATGSIESAARARKMELKVDVAKNVAGKGERGLLMQAVTNLLHNALEFTPEGGRISVELRKEKTGAGIVIEDTGPGIPEFALTRVFERFYSLPRPETGQKSSGLGLTIAREVARRHGGDLSIANRAEGGCRVELRVSLEG